MPRKKGTTAMAAMSCTTVNMSQYRKHFAHYPARKPPCPIAGESPTAPTCHIQLARNVVPWFRASLRAMR